MKPLSNEQKELLEECASCNYNESIEILNYHSNYMIADLKKYSKRDIIRFSNEILESIEGDLNETQYAILNDIINTTIMNLK